MTPIMKGIETKDGRERIIKVWCIKKPHPNLWKWQFNIENAILSFIFVSALIFAIYLSSKLF